MGFPNTGRAEQQDILGMSDKAHGGEVPDRAFIDRGLKGKVKLIQGLVKREAGLTHFPANILLGAGSVKIRLRTPQNNRLKNAPDQRF
jgi:hypothetical protein